MGRQRAANRGDTGQREEGKASKRVVGRISQADAASQKVAGGRWLAVCTAVCTAVPAPPVSAVAGTDTCTTAAASTARSRTARIETYAASSKPAAVAAAVASPTNRIERMRIKNQGRGEGRMAKKAAARKQGQAAMAATISDMHVMLLSALLVAVSSKGADAMSVDAAHQNIGQKCARGGDDIVGTTTASRRDVFRAAASAAVSATSATFIVGGNANVIANAAELQQDGVNTKRIYKQRFPTLFDPIYGQGTRRAIKRRIGPNVWSLEQNLQLGPLQTPLRCVVVRLEDGGGLWVHAPLAPTAEFFELVESCAGGIDGSSSAVRHVVVPSYALEHKVFVKDALMRWPDAQLWTSPGQFSFPVRSVSQEFVFGKSVDGVLSQSDQSTDADIDIPWTNEIQYETLAAGTFNIGGSPTTFYETAFFHKASKSLIVTDAVAKIGQSVPELNDPVLLLLVSKRSTADPQPEDTPEARLIGWEKTALLVSYFFPEHEEPDPDKFGVVTWTDGWHDNFQALSGRLLVPPVVRTLLYAQNPARVREWVNRVSDRWEFEQIVPAHFEAPIKASPAEFKRAFAFLEDDRIDAFPTNDLARGLKPIADLALGNNRKEAIR